MKAHASEAVRIVSREAAQGIVRPGSQTQANGRGVGQQERDAGEQDGFDAVRIHTSEFPWLAPADPSAPHYSNLEFGNSIFKNRPFSSENKYG